MSFRPEVGQEITIGTKGYVFTEHPAAEGMPYGQAGRRATVYQLKAENQALYALKVFNQVYREARVAGVANRLRPFASLPGLKVCQRTVLMPEIHTKLIQTYPDLLYGVLMPWVPGETWQELVLSSKPFQPRESLEVAQTLAYILATMEKKGLAHCDIAGANVLAAGFGGPGEPPVPSGSLKLALVDVEDMFFPGLNRPASVTSGSSGYAHLAAGSDVWSAVGDRFAGAVMLAEMLGWCDERVRSLAHGEHYFGPKEMQKSCERFEMLHTALQEHFGRPAAGLFSTAWQSESLAACPNFQHWSELLGLPPAAVRTPAEGLPAGWTPINSSQAAAVPAATAATESVKLSLERGQVLLDIGQTARAVAELEKAYRLAPALAAGLYAQALLALGQEREESGAAPGALEAYRAALKVAPPGGLRNELPFIIANLEEKQRAAQKKVVADARVVKNTAPQPAALPPIQAVRRPVKKKNGYSFLAAPLLGLGIIAVLISIALIISNLQMHQITPTAVQANATRAASPTYGPIETTDPFANPEPFAKEPTALPTATPAPTISEKTAAMPASRLALVSDHSGLEKIYVLDLPGGEYTEAGLRNMLSFLSPSQEVAMPSGFNRAWWPNFCNGNSQLLFEVQDLSSPKPYPQWIYQVNLNDLRNPAPLATDKSRYPALGVPRCSSGAGTDVLLSVGEKNDPNDTGLSWHMYQARLGDTWTGFVPLDNATPFGNAAWSSDNRWAVYNYRSGSQLHLQKYQFDTKTATNLTIPENTHSDVEKYPSINPAGNQIAFACLMNDDYWHLCWADENMNSVDVYGPQLSHQDKNAPPSDNPIPEVTPWWSPDGRWLAYTSEESGNWDVWLYSMELGTSFNLTQDWGGNQIEPSWSK